MDATSTTLKMIKKGTCSLTVSGSCGDKMVATTSGSIQLRQAAEKGNLEELRTLLAVGTPLVKDQNGLTPFHRAARKGHTNIVRHLLSCAGKTKPNTADYYYSQNWHKQYSSIREKLMLVKRENDQLHVILEKTTKDLQCSSEYYQKHWQKQAKEYEGFLAASEREKHKLQSQIDKMSRDYQHKIEQYQKEEPLHNFTMKNYISYILELEHKYRQQVLSHLNPPSPSPSPPPPPSH